MLVPALLVLTPLPLALPQCLEATEIPPTVEVNSFHGSSIAADGDLVVVGSRGNGTPRRAVVYERIGADWVQSQILDAGLPSGTSPSPVELDGDTALLSDRDDSDGAGKVYVFERGGNGAFVQVQELVPATSLADSHFGRRIEIDGDRIVAAAPMDATTNLRGGTVYVFDRIGGVWTETARVDPPEPLTFGFFGLGLALDGDRFAAAQPSLTTQGFPAHDVSIFTLQGGTWTLEQSLPPTARGFGYGMDMEGDTLVVGAFDETILGEYLAGAAHVYRRRAGVWRLDQTLTWPAGLGQRSLGATVELDEGRLLLSAGGLDRASNAAYALVFEEVAGSFELTHLIERPDAEAEGFGGAAAFAGDDLWIGSPTDLRSPGFGGYAGSVHRYSLSPLVTSYCAPTIANSTGRPSRLDGTGCPTLLRNDLVLRGTDLPGATFALPFLGPTATFLPGAIGGIDTLCVEGGVRGAILQASSTGTVEFAFDLDAIPTPLGPVMGARGDTWFVQLVHRDAGPALRATNAVEITVQ